MAQGKVRKTDCFKYFGKVIKARKLDSLARNLLYSSRSAESAEAIQWGKNHEAVARAQYVSTLGDEFSVNECDILIFPHHMAFWELHPLL